MIERVRGTVIRHADREITVMVRGIGFGIGVARATSFPLNKEVTVYTYLHWNQEKGPLFYGFATELERQVFLLIIDCPKIGPSIALHVLAQCSPKEVLEFIASQNEVGLSRLNGLGPKKAEQIIMCLKNKVSALIAHGSIAVEGAGDTFVHWQHVQEALGALNYSKQEIARALQFLRKTYDSQPIPEVSVLIRRALGFLS